MFRKSALTFILILSLLLGVVPGGFTSPAAMAAEGIQFNVGKLVDETFLHSDSDLFTTGFQSKFSGWETYMFGGTFDYEPWQWFKLMDTSTTDNIELRKRFVNQTTGQITFYFRFKMPMKMDGMSWTLSSGLTNGVKVLTSGGNLCYEDSNGNAVALQSYNANTEYGVKVIADISSKTARIYINGIENATGVAFRNAVSNLDYVSIKTGNSQTGDIYISPVVVHKGYDIYEDCESTMNNVPEDWTTSGSGGTVAVEQFKTQGMPFIYSLKMNDTSSTQNKSISKSFTNETTKSVFEFYFMLPSKVDGMSAQIKSGSNAAINIITKNGNLCYENSSGTAVSIWDNYMANLWYRVKVVADPATDTADIYINGKLKAAEAPFRNTVTGFDSVSYSTPVNATGVIWLDDINFYPYQEYPSDYVPEPVAVQSTNHYVGLQSFPGNKNGYHLGWDFQYVWPEHDLYMGTYDEDKPEAADWQIKYMVEHGVDFFLDCWYGTWYNDSNDPNWDTTPFKYPGLGHNLHDAYFNAKYSNMVKFAISDYNCNYTSDYFRNYVVPFWIEYYFKDPRYMTIDNKVVIALSSTYTDFFTGRSNTEIKADLEYLRQQCINLGFSGATILTRYEGSDKTEMDNLYAMGFDYAYTYNYYNYDAGITDINVIKQKMTDERDAGSDLGYIPTVTVGTSTEAWYGYPSGHVTTSDFQNLCEWVRDIYMPSVPASNLGSKLVLADNWNEYGEGHWIAPGSLNGFGYLDALRTTYAGGGSHVDTIPTLTQKTRLNTNFPKGWDGHSWNFDSIGYTDTEGWYVNPASQVTAKDWGFATSAEDWIAIAGINNFGWAAGGYLNGTLSSSDPILWSPDTLNVDLTDKSLIKIRMKNGTSGTEAKVYFTTNQDSTWSETKSKSFAINANDASYTDYLIDMSAVSGWTGTLKQLRIDPVDIGASNGSFSLDYITIDRSWEFSLNSGGWSSWNGISGFGTSGGSLNGNITSNNPMMASSDTLNMDITSNQIITIRMRNSTPGNTARIYFTTNSDTTWNEAKAKSFAIKPNDSNYTEYTIDMSSVAGWTGTLNQLRFDPVDTGASSGSFSIDYFRISNSYLKDFKNVNGFLYGTISGSDPYMISRDNQGIDLGVNKYVKIKYLNSSANTTAKIYFTTTTDSTWNEAKSKSFTIAANNPYMMEYVVDMSSVSGWNGTLKQLRFDPVDSGSASGWVAIDYIIVTY